MSRIELAPGSQPLPFFAEYAYYVWGEVNYDSEGNCARPTDRAWTWLSLTNRRTREDLSIRVERDTGVIVLEGDSAAAAAALTAQRTGAPVDTAPPDHAERMARADLVAAQFLDPNLAAFDSHGWWGGWKWIGEFSTDFTSGLRAVLQSVHERRLVDPGLLAFLRGWHAEPPRDFHRAGVAFAVDFLGRME